jgi:hypothetical protein
MNLPSNADGAKGPIITAGVITFVGAAANKKHNGYVNPAVATVILCVFLFLIAEVSPKLAVALAILVAVSSMLVNGVPMLDAFSKLTGTTGGPKGGSLPGQQTGSHMPGQGAHSTH